MCTQMWSVDYIDIFMSEINIMVNIFGVLGDRN
jgi:hypothetical protein